MSQPEVWLRGPLPDIPPLLQPVAQSLLQCHEETVMTLGSLTDEQIWRRPTDAATVGFHVRHAIGSLDRLFTYARGETLSASQVAALAAESNSSDALPGAAALIEEFNRAVHRALEQLRATPESSLLETRLVGRARLQSTVLGLLFHAAEHTQRHIGQLVTTAKFVRTADQSR
jgi:DinB superfamily